MANICVRKQRALLDATLQLAYTGQQSCCRLKTIRSCMQTEAPPCPVCSVLGGMTTFLFASVCVSGIKVISIDGFSRRTRFILAVSLGLGFGVTLVRSPLVLPVLHLFTKPHAMSDPGLCTEPITILSLNIKPYRDLARTTDMNTSAKPGPASCPCPCPTFCPRLKHDMVLHRCPRGRPTTCGRRPPACRLA